MRVGIVRDNTFLEHVIDDYHPENPRRLVSIYEMLDSLSVDGIVSLDPRIATQDEIALNHEPSYINFIAGTQGKQHVRLDPDTSTSPKSYEAACLAAGGVLKIVDALFSKEIDNGFALVRPPGHHAERDRAMGFCIFNNIAIGARYLQKKYKLARIMIVDFDLHHGNGTQHSFYKDAEVLYFSTHQYPYYPGTGWFEEVGDGAGKGYTVNLPLSYGMGDDDYLYAFQEILLPIADIYKPQFVLVSAGFDAYYNDPLGGMVVTEEGYAGMTKILLDIASKHSDGKVLFALEGGYDIKGLTSSVKSVMLEMLGVPPASPSKALSPSAEMVRIAGKVKDVLGPYWKGI